MNKTTKSDFKYFKLRCEHYVKLWKLIEWDIDYEHSNGQGSDRAACSRTILGMHAVIELCFNWEHEKVTKQALNRIAKHEVLHILLAPIELLAQARFVTEDEYKAGDHTVIQKLIKLLPDH